MYINKQKMLIFPPYIHFQFINRPNIFFFWKEHMHFRLQHLEIMLFLFILKFQFVSLSQFYSIPQIPKAIFQAGKGP